MLVKITGPEALIKRELMNYTSDWLLRDLHMKLQITMISTHMCLHHLEYCHVDNNSTVCLYIEDEALYYMVVAKSWISLYWCDSTEIELA